MATAIESIYRDLEYARTLIKVSHAIADGEEDATIRRRSMSTTFSSPRSSADSYLEGQENSEDWSVISDSDDRKSRRSSHHSAELRPSPKRTGLAAAVLSVLPDALQGSSAPKPSSRR